MKPTIGRVVLFHPSEGEIHAAIIAFVHSDTMVNLAAFDANGVAYSRTSVTLVQPGQAAPEFSPYCEWMPYQVGQARKVLDLPVVQASPAAG
ncbi:hypothetical protein [Rhodoferax aquaticus]|uniref:Uncharacterized protein n=1 Tax=Rhodoferax aquaticus TaxID=2527691 RepID=A0A515ERQ5_9BURK|nr:hypothetical protein [Rhodoferax aquaticus]QDL55330.1 hypothetical protein EXZ61_14765 [Rhodoferax aquaticus]